MREWLWPDPLVDKIVLVLGLWVASSAIFAAVRGEWGLVLGPTAIALAIFGLSFWTFRLRQKSARHAGDFED